MKRLERHKQSIFLYIDDVCRLMECGKTKAGEMVRAVNDRIEADGYIRPMRGRTYRKKFYEVFGIKE